MTIRLTLPVPPSANVFYRTVNGRMLLSREGRDYKALVFVMAKQQRIAPPLLGPVTMTVWWYRERKSGDLDNRLKALQDALQDVAYLNDSQIVELHAYRDDSDPKHARVEVTIEVP